MADRSSSATYAIGDIHGCYQTLERLWDDMPFDPARDRLWLVGDLVNRGPRSFEVLRWARERSLELGDRFVSVLGNHDLHLLALASGQGLERRRPALDQVLEADDADRLIAWLRHRPLLHHHARFLLVHAGLLPSWSVAAAIEKARRAEAVLVGEDGVSKLLSKESASTPERRALEVMTRIRTCTRDQRLCEFTGPPSDAPEGCMPWFEVEDRQSRDVTVVAGHWAALGLRIETDFLGLDSACVYGGRLTAVRLEDRRVFSCPNRD